RLIIRLIIRFGSARSAVFIFWLRIVFLVEHFNELLFLQFFHVALFPLELSNQPVEIALRHGRYGNEGKAAQGVVGVVGHYVTWLCSAVLLVFFIEADAGYLKNPLFLQALLLIVCNAGFIAAGGDVQQFTGQVAFAVVHLYFQINIVRRRNVVAVSGAA